MEPINLSEVTFWAYNIQKVQTARQRTELVGTHFDMYVLEPVVTEVGEENFDIAGLVRDIREYNQQNYMYGKNPLMLAYVDMGQAENWRWYCNWQCSVGNPDWITALDPNGWDDNFPVQYWRQEWKEIVITGEPSHMNEILKAGFDGIYMDWVEAFSDVHVIAAAQKAGVDPAAEMLQFLEEIRDYGRFQSNYANPNFLVVAQNAPDLYVSNPTRYRNAVDAVAMEAVWFEGDGGFDRWGDPRGYNVITNDMYPGWTEEVLGYLTQMSNYMPVFVVEYAQDVGGNNRATEVYTQLAPQYGFIPYCTRRSLAKLSKSPYPLGYEPLDY